MLISSIVSHTNWECLYPGLYPKDEGLDSRENFEMVINSRWDVEM